MKQPTAKVTENDIKRLIERDFPNYKYENIIDILNTYNPDSNDNKYRVFAAILKLSNKNFESLKECVKLAQIDFRDVISSAEYPEYSQKIGFKDYDENIKNKIIENDYSQYQKWFNNLSKR